jgi:hypothetical protein
MRMRAMIRGRRCTMRAAEVEGKAEGAEVCAWAFREWAAVRTEEDAGAAVVKTKAIKTGSGCRKC